MRAERIGQKLERKSEGLLNNDSRHIHRLLGKK